MPLHFLKRLPLLLVVWAAFFQQNAGGDPINHADPTGMVTAQLYTNLQNLSQQDVQWQMSKLDINGEMPTYAQWFTQQAAAGVAEGLGWAVQGAGLLLPGVGEVEEAGLAVEGGAAAVEGAEEVGAAAVEGAEEVGAGATEAGGAEAGAAMPEVGGQYEFGYAEGTASRAPEAAEAAEAGGVGGAAEEAASSGPSTTQGELDLGGSGEASQATSPATNTATAQTEIPTIGGRLPINSKYAGGTHPSGVSFNQQGFPDFSPYAQKTVVIDDLTGQRAIDEALANKAAGYPSTPQGYTWHHVEDGKTMQLVPRDIHQATAHTGGAAVIRNGGAFDQ
jgi:hypothetical protein